MPNTEPSMTAQPASARAIPPGTYLADSARSQLSFRAKAFGLIWVHGHMPAVGGTIHVTEGRLRGTGEVAASRVSTGLRARDWHLRTRHYLHTTRHPNIQLSVDDADIASGHADFRVVARGKPASIGLELDSVQVSDGTLRLQAHGTIDRSPFRMLPPPYGVSRLVHVVLTVVATPAATHRERQ
jgi:polyisoprenoid-binding protein YceI